jgi:hypothetical protein
MRTSPLSLQRKRRRTVRGAIRRTRCPRRSWLKAPVAVSPTDGSYITVDPEGKSYTHTVGQHTMMRLTLEGGYPDGGYSTLTAHIKDKIQALRRELHQQGLAGAKPPKLPSFGRGVQPAAVLCFLGPLWPIAQYIRM